MAKHVEMDERIKFKDQIEEKIDGSVIVIVKLNVEPDKVEQFVNDWAKDAAIFKNNLDLFLHNYIRELERVAYSLCMKFGSQ